MILTYTKTTMKTVIFNVKDALSAYVEYGDCKVVIDLGKSDEFSPVNDFLVPRFKKIAARNPLEQKSNSDKFYIDQLILSHPHKDHISDIQDFDKYFYPRLLTTPNAKDAEFAQNINWKHITSPDDEDVKYLQGMITSGRNPPLRAADERKMVLAYLYPRDVENNSDLDNESYTNNISLVVFFKSQYCILFPGDLQKEGMKALLNGTIQTKNGKILKNDLLAFGVDFLVTPHHGLKSSFSTELFKAMKGGKTKKLNIVPEKATTPDDVRQVDSRYSTSEYCEGDNNLSEKDSPVCQRKTSNGHIFINDDGSIIIEKDINEILKYFN